MVQRIVSGFVFAIVATACSSSSSPSASTNGSDGGGAAAKGAIGAACPNGTSDCQVGLLCDGNDPHGQCYKECAPSTDADCGDTSKYACSFEGHCYLICTTTDDCARKSEGYVCKPDSPDRGVRFCDAAD